MQLIRHLNDEELTDLLLQRNEDELRQTLETLPGSLRSSTDFPEWFWQAQQAAIRRRVAAPLERLHQVTAWAAATVLVVLALVLLHGNPAPRPRAAQTDPDQELLVAVEQAVQSEVPSALEPAALLADEISNGAAQPHATTSKERRNEN